MLLLRVEVLLYVCNHECVEVDIDCWIFDYLSNSSSQTVEGRRDQLSVRDDRQQLKAFRNNRNKWFDCWRCIVDVPTGADKMAAGRGRRRALSRRGALIVHKENRQLHELLC